jgi:hypothetical protein
VFRKIMAQLLAAFSPQEKQISIKQGHFLSQDPVPARACVNSSPFPRPQAPKVRNTKAQGNVLGNGPTPTFEGQRPDLTTEDPKTLLQKKHDLTQSTPPEKTPKAFRPPAQGWSHEQRPSL